MALGAVSVSPVAPPSTSALLIFPTAIAPPSTPAANPDPSLTDSWQDCPYPGLRAFDQEAPYFLFGRQRTLNLLLQRLEQFNVVPLIGPAGSGKSSLLQARLLPELAHKGWQIQGPLHTDIHPLETLLSDLQGWVQQTRESPGMTFPGAIAATLPPPRTLIVLDACGNVAGTNPIGQRPDVAFWESLLQLTWLAQGRLVVLVSLRPEALTPWFTSHPLIPVLQNQAVWLPPLDQAEAVDAIVRPVQLQGYQLEPGLLDRLLADSQAESQPLPLLQITLQQLWQYRDRAQQCLLHQPYDQIGGVAGALNTYAEQVYARLTPAEQVWTQRLCQEWVVCQPGGRLVRRSRSLLELLALTPHPQEQALIRQVVNQLLRSHLLTVIPSDRSLPSAIAPLTDTNPHLTLAQEVLCERWQRLVNWLTVPSGSLAPVAQSPTGPVAVALTALPLTSPTPMTLTQLVDSLTTHPLEGARLVLAAIQDPAQDFSVAERVALQGSLRQILEITREQQCFDGQQEAVQSLAISPDGHWFVSGSADGTVRCWERQGPVPVSTWVGHTDAIAAIAVSPDGHQIVTGSWDGTLRLWDRTGQAIAPALQGHTDFITAVTFNPAGDLILSASIDGTLRLWDRQGQPRGEPLSGYPGLGTAVAISPDGSLIVAGSTNGTLIFWDWAGRVVHPWVRAHRATITDLAFSPDGTLMVSASSDGTLRLWDGEGRAIGQPLQGHTDSVETVAFSPDGQLILSGSADMTLQLWDCWGNSVGPPLVGHQDAVEAVAFFPDGRQALSASSDGTIRCWEVWGNRLGPDLRGHTDLIEAIAFSPDGTWLVSGGWDHTLRRWDLQGDTPPLCWEGHTDCVAAVVVNPTGDLIASGSWEGEVCLWTPTGDCVQRYTIAAAITCLGFSPDNQFLWAGSADGFLHCWSLRSEGGDCSFPAHRTYLAALALSQDGHYLVSASADGTLQIWDPNEHPPGKLNQTAPLRGHTAEVVAVAISPDSRLIASGGRDGSLRLWNAQGQALADLTRIPAISTGMRHWGPNADGAPIPSSSSSPPLPPIPVASLAFSPDGSQILVGHSDGSVCLWDVAAHALIGPPWQAHADFVTTVAFSPDGQTIATGSADRTIRRWRGGNWQDWLHACHDRLSQHALS